MDCIGSIETEHRKLDGRAVSLSFRLAVIEEALRFISTELAQPAAPSNVQEILTACEEALEALAELKSTPQLFP